MVVEPDVLPDSPPPVVIEGDVGTLLAKANDFVAIGLLENGRRLTPQSAAPGNNAVDLYRRVLELDPGNAAATEGLRRIADYFESRAKQILDRGGPNADVVCNSILENAVLAEPARASVLRMLENECKISLD